MFNYKGNEIEVLKNGAFRAVIKGENVVKSSMSAMKKHIDNKEKSAFQPFTALRESNPYDDSKKIPGCEDLTRIDVINVREGSNYGRTKRPMFFEEGSPFGHTELIIDTPENIALYASYVAHRAETKAIKERRSEEEDELYAKIKLLKAEDFLKIKQ